MGKKAGFTIFVIFLLTLATFLVSGCQGFGRRQDEPTGAGFVSTGSQALQMRFLPNMPPDKTYTQTPITAMLEVRNVGTYDMTTLNIYLTGFDPMIIPFQTSVYPVPLLEARSRFNPEGGYDTVEYTSSPIQLPQGTFEYNPTLLATACYIYKTTASPLICIDPNPTDVLSDKPCQVQNVGTGSQGAPVAVSNVEVQSTPKDTLLRIQVQNVGSGVLMKEVMVGNCMQPLQFKELNEVRYSVIVGGEGGSPLQCKPDNNVLRLIDNQGTIFCSVPHSLIQGGSAYETPLRISLDYGYKESISQKITIENIEN